MPTGVIKYYNSDKGYGFIQQEQGEDLFFFFSSFDKEPENLTIGQGVNFEISPGKKGPEAKQITLEGEIKEAIDAEVGTQSEKKDNEPKPQTKKTDSQKPKKQKKSMMNAFWDEYIESGEVLNFYFFDKTMLRGKLLERDTYHLKVDLDGKTVLIFKHALESVGPESD